MPSGPKPSAVRFGVFELNIRAGELRKNGMKVRLQEQPFRVLEVLLEQVGDLVTRQELKQRLWPDDTFVDFDNSLNTAVNKLREVLNDSASSPRFVETVPRRGYRFVAPVERVGEPSSAEPERPTGAVGRPAPDRQTLRSLWIAVIALSVLLTLALLGLLPIWREPTRPLFQASLRRFSYQPAETAASPVISPNGHHIAYITGPALQRALWVQDLDQEEPRQIIAPSDLHGTPFWSAGSDFVVFASGQELKKVSVGGGAAVTLCRLPGESLAGGSWSEDGSSIVFGTLYRRELYEVPTNGGKAAALFKPDTSEQPTPSLLGPQILPSHKGNRAVLFVEARPTKRARRIAVQDLATGSREILAEGSAPFYAPSGHVLYETLAPPGIWAVPFSLDTLQRTGEPFRVREDATSPSVSRDGTLVYLERSTRLKQMVWRGRKGEELGVIGQPQRDLMMPVLSPDGARVVVMALEGGYFDIWVHDVARGLKTRFTFHAAAEDRPLWLPGGDKISFSSARNGNMDIFIKSADGRGEPQELLATPYHEFGYAWSQDGQYLIFDQSHEGRRMDIYYLCRKSDDSGYESFPIVATEFDELSPDLSRDSRFVAYESNQSGRYDVYVQPFPEGQGRWPVSANGGRQPRWSKDGKELFYVEDDTLIAVSVQTNPTFSVGRATRLFDAPGAFDGRGHRYDVSADGQRFIIVEPAEEASPPVIRVVQNWFAEFRDRQPAE